MTLVVILSVRVHAVDAFREFEQRAAEVMTRHGGRIDRTVVIPPPAGQSLMKEVHIVTFPTESAFLAYRKDPALADIAELRMESIESTEILIGHDGPRYHQSV